MTNYVDISRIAVVVASACSCANPGALLLCTEQSIGMSNARIAMFGGCILRYLLV